MDYTVEELKEIGKRILKTERVSVVPFVLDYTHIDSIYWGERIEFPVRYSANALYYGKSIMSQVLRTEDHLGSPVVSFNNIYYKESYVFGSSSTIGYEAKRTESLFFDSIRSFGGSVLMVFGYKIYSY